MKPETEVDNWNSKHPVGTPVMVTRDDGSQVATRTRSEATTIGGHAAVIWLEGIRGCYQLDRVRPA